MGAGAAGLVTKGLFAQPTLRQARKPNIVVVLADDLGYADLGCQGCADIPTPHIDSLAQGGVRFTNGYVSCPVCSPTRAGLMTGRYQQRFGHEFNPGASGATAPEVGLPLSQVTLAQVLRTAGYATGLVGKWHLGGAPHFHPLRRGFDEFFGFLSGSHPYLAPGADPRNPILRGTEPVDEKEYLTDAFSREAVAFIARHRDQPFFLYLAYNAVHTPLQATPNYLARFEHIADQRRRTYAAMLSAMDDGVGAVLAELRRSGVERDTMIFFLSDNGGPTEVNGSRNTPLSGVKGMVREGGIRVPFILRWPARIPGGKTYDAPVISLDIFPTAVAAAGGTIPRDRVMDGVDLLPHILGHNSGAPHDFLFWRMDDQHAVRRGKWKLVRIREAETELCDLSRDVAETTNLASREPMVAQALSRALAAWESQLATPIWGPAGQPGRPRARRRPRAGLASPKGGV
jgi:arylsulfatase A-like enzyme